MKDYLLITEEDSTHMNDFIELDESDLQLGKIVSSRQIRKFKNLAIVLGHAKDELDEEGRPYSVGEIVFIGKSLSELNYKEGEDELTYIKGPAVSGIPFIDVEHLSLFQKIKNLKLYKLFKFAFDIYFANTSNMFAVYVSGFLFNLINLVLYAWNGDKVAVYLYVFNTIRTFIYIHREKFKTSIIPISSIIITILIGIIFNQTPIQFISTAIMCYVCWYTWYVKDMHKLRLGNIIQNTSWLAYSLITHLFLLSLIRTAITAIQVYIYRKRINLKE